MNWWEMVRRANPKHWFNWLDVFIVIVFFSSSSSVALCASWMACVLSLSFIFGVFFYYTQFGRCRFFLPLYHFTWISILFFVLHWDQMYLLVCDIFCLFDRSTQFRSYTRSFSHCYANSIRYNLLVLSDKVGIRMEMCRTDEKQRRRQQQHACTHTCMQSSMSFIRWCVKLNVVCVLALPLATLQSDVA